MPGPHWLFGPAGDLRPLPAPAGDVVNTVDRFGATHVAITGGRTVDTLGYRARYEFELPYLDEEEYFRLEALYTLADPRPLKLIDPMRRNLLSRDAALAKPADATQRGLSASLGAGLAWVRVTDSPVSWSARGARWTGFGAGDTLQVGRGATVPVTPGESVTFSVYLSASEAQDVAASLDTISEGLPHTVVPGDTVPLPAGSWTRLEQTFVVPAGAQTAYITLHAVTAAGALTAVAPQLESGTTATAPSLGGGAVTVLIEELATTSPRHPYRSVSLSLLEV